MMIDNSEIAITNGRKMKLIGLFSAINIVLLLTCVCSDKKYDKVVNRNVEVIESYVREILNKGNLSFADLIIGDEFVDPLSTTGKRGPNGLKKILQVFRQFFLI